MKFKQNVKQHLLLLMTCVALILAICAPTILAASRAAMDVESVRGTDAAQTDDVQSKAVVSDAQEEPEEPEETKTTQETTLGTSVGNSGGAAVLRFDNGDGTGRDAVATDPRNLFGNVGDTVRLPDALEKEGRVFSCWYSELKGETYPAGADYVIAGDDVFVAQWDMPQELAIDAVPKRGDSLDGAELFVTAVSEDEHEAASSAIESDLADAPVDLLGVCAADISFLDAAGAQLQPESGETVPVYLTVPQESVPENADYLLVYHIATQADGSCKAEPVEFASVAAGDQKIYFEADGFSIYAVAAVGQTTGTPIQDGDYYELAEEHQKVFYFADDIGSNRTYRRYVWRVENNDDIVRAYTTAMPGANSTDDSVRYKYPWITVDALRPGRVDIVLTYYYYNGRDWWSPTNSSIQTGTATIKLLVTQKENGLRIVNNITNDGTLVPEYYDANQNLVTDVRYEWSCMYFYVYNNDDSSSGINPTPCDIDDAAVQDDGSINVAIDAGGITQEKDADGRDMLRIKTYTCTAYDLNGNELDSTSHRVEYGEDILNGSFEYPRIPWGTNYAFANYTRHLSWKTTALGSGYMLGQDVELGNDSAGNPYLTSGAKANDGTQFAELNAEAAGTLYQDVLTAPGATLSWSFAHRSRKGTGINQMYLIIAASHDASKIATQSDINALIARYNGDGVTITYDGGSYTLWQFQSDELSWDHHYGSYTVPEGQYATRFFFASATGTTLGNLLDSVHFNEEQRYIIEYYLGGVLQSDLTEIGTAEIDSVVLPKNRDNAVFNDAVLTSTTINGENYGGVSMSIKPRTPLDAVHADCSNVLRLYYSTGAITVTKVVTIEGWDDLTSAEREALWGEAYTAHFELYDGNAAVAEADVTIDLNEQTLKTGLAQFIDKTTGNAFRTKLNHTYTVVEIPNNVLGSPVPRIYELETTYAPNADGTITTDRNGNAAVTVTNAYTHKLVALTIVKNGWEEIDENQTFVYRITGADGFTQGVTDLTVTIHGNGSVTITELAAGSYNVEEITSWSWRYTPDEAIKTVELTEDKTVTFHNDRAHEGDTGTDWKWLNGASWCENRWIDGKKYASGEAQ